MPITSLASSTPPNSRALGIDGKTVASYLDLLVDLLLVRRLQPWHANSSKRLVKSPKIYVRDSGLTHSLLGVGTQEQLLGHPVAGGSWEGFVTETLSAADPSGTRLNFYRTSAGAEIDVLLTLPGSAVWAIEIKRSLAPKVEKGFHLAAEEIKPDRRIVIYPGTEIYRLPHDVEAMPLAEIGADLAKLG